MSNETDNKDTTPENPLVVKLKELGVSDEHIDLIQTKLGVESVDDLSVLTEADLTTEPVSMATVPARKLISAVVKPAVETPSSSAVNSVSLDVFLPDVPNDESWLEALKTGGVLKVDQSTVISAIRAALAHKAGLFKVPKKLASAMEKFADTSEEQVDPVYFSILQQMTRNNYAEVFSAIPGLNGNYVTEPRKKELLNKLDMFLWPAIFEFYSQLNSWQDTWMKGASNPAVMMNAIMAANGGVGAAIPSMMQQPPDTSVLRDTADSVVDAINKVFSGTGVQITAALAYDANKIKETLQNNKIPALVGATNRDQMLRQLDVSVPPTYPRLENNLTRFVLSIMQAKDQPAGNEEIQYFGSMYMLGSQIPWEQIGSRGFKSSRTATGIGENL